MVIGLVKTQWNPWLLAVPSRFPRVSTNRLSTWNLFSTWNMDQLSTWIPRRGGLD